MGFSNEGWFFFVLSLVPTISFGWWYFYLGKSKGPRLYYSCRGQSILEISLATHVTSDIAVTFKGNSISQLSVATATFWNSGDNVLTRDALVDRDRLGIRLLDFGTILDAAIWNDIYDGSREIKIVLCADNAERAHVDFRFLNPGEGFVVRILHTSEIPEVAVSGSLIGANIYDQSENSSKMKRGIIFGASALLIFAFGAGCFTYGVIKYSGAQGTFAFLWALVPISAIFATGHFFNTMIERANSPDFSLPFNEKRRAKSTM